MKQTNEQGKGLSFKDPELVCLASVNVIILPFHASKQLSNVNDTNDSNFKWCNYNDLSVLQTVLVDTNGVIVFTEGYWLTMLFPSPDKANNKGDNFALTSGQ